MEDNALTFIYSETKDEIIVLPDNCNFLSLYRGQNGVAFSSDDDLFNYAYVLSVTDEGVIEHQG